MARRLIVPRPVDRRSRSSHPDTGWKGRIGQLCPWVPPRHGLRVMVQLVHGGIITNGHIDQTAGPFTVSTVFLGNTGARNDGVED